MIRKIRINNYKSIPDLTLELGRVTVLIGANGSGKSNILEGIALASAASQNKLDNEFLISRGIRTTEPKFTFSAFKDMPSEEPVHGLSIVFAEEDVKDPGKAIKVLVEDARGGLHNYEVWAELGRSYPKWIQRYPIPIADFRALIQRAPEYKDAESLELFLQQAARAYLESKLPLSPGSLLSFLIFAPENSVLRTFQTEGQILPLGIKGEGLFAHLKALNFSSGKNRARLEEIKIQLALVEWFEGFDIPEDLEAGERSIRISDRFLPKDALFDQRSANEGFLFLLFYVTLLVSPETPAFFSIDNIDSSLNPKMCVALLKQMVALAKKYDKQLILTTHNPAVLDGLDLHDDEQRLLVVDRNKSGHTRVRRIDPPKPAPGQLPVRLSEAFLRGYIGGLPNNF